MRTAHLIVSGAALAMWLVASVAGSALGNPPWGIEWWVAVPVAVMPPFWCVYAWFATRRSDVPTSRLLVVLAVPVLLCGLGVAAEVTYDIAPNDPFTFGHGRSNVVLCGWFPAAAFGFISFIWAILLQVNSLRQPPEPESGLR